MIKKKLEPINEPAYTLKRSCKFQVISYLIGFTVFILSTAFCPFDCKTGFKFEISLHKFIMKGIMRYCDFTMQFCYFLLFFFFFCLANFTKKYLIITCASGVWWFIFYHKVTLTLSMSTESSANHCLASFCCTTQATCRQALGRKKNNNIQSHEGCLTKFSQ